MPESLYPLALLACPVGMGVMMWMMSRGHGDQAGSDEAPAKQDELARLQAEIDQLQAAQRDHDRGGAVSGPSA
jgi:hypothetical protein